MSGEKLERCIFQNSMLNYMFLSGECIKCSESDRVTENTRVVL